jgi:hypothetical protein
MRIGNEVRKTSGNGNRKSIGDETRKGIGEEARKGIRNESHASAQETGCCGWNKKALTAKCDDGVRETVGSARTSRITPEWRVAVIWVPNQIFENRKAGARSRKRNRPIAFNHQRTTRHPPYRDELSSALSFDLSSRELLLRTAVQQRSTRPQVPQR